MCSLNSTSSGAALLLGAFMDRLCWRGDGIDEHEFSEVPLTGGRFTQQRHRFNYLHEGNRTIELFQEVSFRRNPLTSFLEFRSNWCQQLSPVALGVFQEVNAKRHFTTMFAANGDDLMIGSFFGRRSEIRDSISRFILSLEESQDIPLPYIGEALWRLIMRHGGLPTLFELWDELFEEEVKHQMLLLDPYCFDE